MRLVLPDLDARRLFFDQHTTQRQILSILLEKPIHYNSRCTYRKTPQSLSGANAKNENTIKPENAPESFWVKYNYAATRDRFCVF